MTGPNHPDMPLPAQSPAQESRVLGSSRTGNPYSLIMNHLTKIQRQSSENRQPDEFVGVVLYSTREPLESSQFVKLFPKGTPFYKEVLADASRGSRPKTGASITSCYCYVPELSGFLPFPDTNIISRYNTIQYKKQQTLGAQGEESAETNAAEIQSNLREISSEIWKEWAKIVHYPIFHKYTEAATSPGQWAYVKVRLSKTLNTTYEGVLLEELQESWVPPVPSE